jgi:serine/threonine protein kinase
MLIGKTPFQAETRDSVF